MASTTRGVSVKKLSLYCCLVLLFGCGSAPSSPRSLPTLKEATAARMAEEAEGASLAAYELARVAPGTYGPISLALEGGTLSVWASPGPKERTWFARSIDRDGHAAGPSHAIGTTSLELGLVTLAAVSQGLRSLLVYSTQGAEQTTKLQALLLDPSGNPKSALIELGRTDSPLLWTQVVDTQQGPLVLYAVSRDPLAEVRAVGLTPDGTIRLPDREVLGGLRAWQVVPAPDGATLAVVRASSQGQGGIVSLLLLDRNAATTSGPINLDERGTADLELDLVRVGNNYVAAWSDRSAIDARIYLAAVDPSGRVVTKPTAGFAAMGEQMLIKLVAPAKSGRAVLVWENPTLPYARRMLSLAEVDQNGRVADKIVHLACSSRSNTLPEIVATDEGLRVLTFDDVGLTPTSEVADPMPTFVEFGPELTPRAAAPLALRTAHDRTTVPLLAWGLDCRHGCRATAALDDNPVTIATVDLVGAAKLPKAAERVRELAFVAPRTTPGLVSMGSIAEVEPLADLDVVRTADGFKVATLTYFDPSTPLKRLTKAGPDGRFDPLQARVDVLPVRADGTLRAPQTISYRAASLPGLAVATARAEGDGTLVGWAAPEQGQPQLFVSRLGSDDKRQAQRMLTHKRGRLDGISVVTAADGWLLAWVDERTNEQEVYATRIASNLERRGNEQRLTSKAGDVSALTLAPLGEDSLAVFAASPRAKKKPVVELFARRLSSKDAQPLETERTILELGGSIKFLSAASYGDGLLLGWLEIATSAGLADANATLRFLQLDSKGQPVRQPTSLPLSGVVPASLAFECPNASCRVVVIVDVGGRGELQGLTFDPSSSHFSPPVPLARSLGTVEQNVAPVILGDDVFMVDQIDAERTRIVHARLKWN